MKEMKMRPDAIDRAAGLDPSDPAFSIRDQRPEFVNGTAACQPSVLTPKNDLGLSPDLRAAIARRVAATSENAALIAEYPAPSCETLLALAEGQEPTDPQLKAIAQHADMIARSPGEARKAHLQELADAGLSTPQIIALSELLAFVCFQIQVAHGISLLRQTG